MQLYADDPIRQIFANLDAWRHLPSYRLECRFDIFLTPYLRRIVEDAVGEPVSAAIVPEMPLKQLQSNLSDKADYVLFSQDGATAYIVELKTDCAPVRPEQVACLNRIAATPWVDTLCGVSVIALGTRHRRKYFHLLSLLERAGQVRLEACMRETFRSGARYKAGSILYTSIVRRVVPIFLTPRAVEGLKCITFADVRRTLGGISGDPMASLLAGYLERWECDAGLTPPKEEPVLP